MISMDKKYRVEGFDEARILAVDLHDRHGFPVFAALKVAEEWEVYPFRPDGTTPFCQFKLIEVTPYDDFKIDEPVMVRKNEEEKWLRRHFAGVSSDGHAQAFAYGTTSWTNFSNRNRVAIWHECRRPTPEELANG